MNDLSWRARRAAARWLFVERRMEMAAEEITLPGALLTADALGYTAAREPRTYQASVRREVRIVEVKVSRGDLRHGIRKGQVSSAGLGSVADFCHLMVPRGMVVKDGELPDRWGLLEYVEGNGAASVYALKPAKRLTPASPLTDEQAERVMRAVVQSTMWRHYSYQTTVAYKRVADAGEYGDWTDRVIEGDGPPALTSVP